jgi:hypothetical protein
MRTDRPPLRRQCEARGLWNRVSGRGRVLSQLAATPLPSLAPTTATVVLTKSPSTCCWDLRSEQETTEVAPLASSIAHSSQLPIHSGYVLATDSQ